MLKIEAAIHLDRRFSWLCFTIALLFIKKISQWLQF